MSGTVGPRFGDPFSMDFDGTNEYLQTVSTFDTLDNETQWTLSFWVKPNTLVSEPLFRLTTGTGTFFAYVRNTGVIDTSYPSSSSYTRSTGTLSVDDWSHVCIRHDGTTGNRYSMHQVWINGEEGDTSNYFGAANFGTSSSVLTIGWNTTTTWADYKLNELAVFIGDVSPLEIYNQNNGKPGDLDKFSTKPTNWWRMGELGIWDGSQWTLQDKMGNLNLESNNMGENNRVLDTP
tara:strand:- start:4302 stop:5003 length:702 start_codon:yes stop_codon:yes gene_type:complete